MRIRTREDWMRIRAGGKRRFLLLSGVVGRGLPLGLLVALAIQVLRGEPLPDSLASTGFALRLLLAVAVFSLSGCVSAAMIWRMYEKQFGADPASGRGAPPLG